MPTCFFPGDIIFWIDSFWCYTACSICGNCSSGDPQQGGTVAIKILQSCIVRLKIMPSIYIANYIVKFGGESIIKYPDTDVFVIGIAFNVILEQIPAVFLLHVKMKVY